MPKLLAAALTGLLLSVLSGCTSGRCCSPCSTEPPTGVAAVPDINGEGGWLESDYFESRDGGKTWTRIEDARLLAARKAWTDEITEGNKRLATRLYEANKEADSAARERKRFDCVEQFKAEMKANDESYEQAKAAIRASMAR